jgi:hypothetical protein
MTTECIELDFDVTPRERARARDFLTALAIKKRDGIISRLSRPPLFWLLGIPCTIIIVPNLLRFLGEIRQGYLPEGFGLTWVLGFAFAIYLLGYEAKLIWDWLRHRLGVGRLGWVGREGVHWGTCRMTATDDTLILEREKCRTTYRWPAILGIEESKHALFLMLTRHSAVVVPKSAFTSRALEQSFRDFVEPRLEATH